MVSRDDDFLLLLFSVRRARARRDEGGSEAGIVVGCDEGDDKRDMLRGYFTTPESSKSDDIDLVRDIKRRGDFY